MLIDRSTLPKPSSQKLYEFTSDPESPEEYILDLNFHQGQWQAWNSTARFVALLAGTQSGKTSFGPLWLYREIQECGPGDYFVVTPTFPLLQLKALPEFLRLFGEMLGLGEYVGSPIKRFTFSKEGAELTFGDSGYDPHEVPTNVYFGHAQDPDSLESATAKAAWLDEAGQKKFRLDSWQAVQRRLSIAMGRALLTTTIYNLGWLKSEIYDPWVAGDLDYEVVQFRSVDNPAFPEEEDARARRTLPWWKYAMFYLAQFTRPAGLIYDSFQESHVIEPFEIPNQWPRYLGLDFGGVNTAALFYAQDPITRELYLYREYKATSRSAKEHTKYLLEGEPMVPTAAGGSKSEDNWRREFAEHGLHIKGPKITDVEVGIDRVYAAHKEDQIKVFDTCRGYLEEKRTYQRELDERGEPTEKIEDKETFHYMDAERYLIQHLRSGIETQAPLGVGNRPSYWLSAP